MATKNKLVETSFVEDFQHDNDELDEDFILDLSKVKGPVKFTEHREKATIERVQVPNSMFEWTPEKKFKIKWFFIALSWIVCGIYVWLRFYNQELYLKLQAAMTNYLEASYQEFQRKLTNATITAIKNYVWTYFMQNFEI